jgi:hypothetical protein
VRLLSNLVLFFASQPIDRVKLFLNGYLVEFVAKTLDVVLAPKNQSRAACTATLLYGEKPENPTLAVGVNGQSFGLP